MYILFAYGVICILGCFGFGWSFADALCTNRRRNILATCIFGITTIVATIMWFMKLDAITPLN